MPLTKAEVESWPREKLEEQFYLHRGEFKRMQRKWATLQDQVSACKACQHDVLQQQIDDNDAWHARLNELLGNPMCGMEHEIKRLQAREESE